MSAAAASAAAGAGSPSSAAALAPVVAGAPAGRVFVKRFGDAHALFARVEIFADDAVADLADRASRVRGWGVDAAYVKLFLVKPASAEKPFAAPTQAQIDAELADEGNALGEGMPLPLVEITSGAWVVARLSAPPAAAAPGECVRSCLGLARSRAEWFKRVLLRLLRSASQGVLRPTGRRRPHLLPRSY